MVLLFADGFEDAASAWAIGAGMSVGTGRFGSGIVNNTGSSNATATWGVTATAGPLIFGFAYKAGSVAGDLFVAGTSPYPSIYVSRVANGSLNVFNRSAALLGSSAAGVVPSSAWSFIETKVTVSPTTGTVVIRVNGVEVINLSGKDTGNPGAAPPNSITTIVLGYMAYGGGAATPPAGTAYDDFYLCDGTGTVNNDFLGEIMVEHLRPGTDDVAQWLGSDGNSVNNWDLVDEAGAANTADYVASSTVGQRDLYVPVASARPIGSPVMGVLVVANAMKTDVGTRTVKLDVKEGAGGAVRQGPDTGLPTSFGELRATFDRKADGSQFTVADVNNLRFGVEVST